MALKVAMHNWMRPEPIETTIERLARAGYVRIGSVQYCKDTIDLIVGLGGKMLTVVPSTVGKIVPMGSPEDEWKWAIESLKEVNAYAEDKGIRLALEPLNRFETYFLNRHDQALALAEDVGGTCGVCLDIFHMNIEEADWEQALRTTAEPDELYDRFVKESIDELRKHIGARQATPA